MPDGGLVLEAEAPRVRLKSPGRPDVAWLLAEWNPDCACERSRRSRGADVAQLVEQLIRNQQVSGSNPLVGSRRNPYRIGV